MNSHQNSFPDSASGASKNRQGDAPSVEATLRWIATLTPPAGLEDRIHARLRAQLNAGDGMETSESRVYEWPSSRPVTRRWLQNDLLRCAAAAAIVAIIVGGGWGITSRIQPATTAKGTALPDRVAGPSHFSTAGAMRTPQTLHGPVVLPGTTPTPPISTNAVKTKTVKKPTLHSEPIAQEKANAATQVDREK